MSCEERELEVNNSGKRVEGPSNVTSNPGG